MNRPVRISYPVEVGISTMMSAAEDEVGGLQVRIGLFPWEQLRIAMPALDDADRRDAALFELEQLSTPDRMRLIDGERVVDILTEDIDAIVTRIKTQPGDDDPLG